VFTYVFMYVFMYVCMCLRVCCACVCMCACACANTCMCVCAYVCIVFYGAPGSGKCLHKLLSLSLHVDLYESRKNAPRTLHRVLRTLF